MFPPRCPLCGDGVSTQGGLCAECWGELAIPGEPSCTACGRPFGEGVPPGAMCAPCLADPPRHAGIAAATLYNDASRKLVLAFKHGSRLGLATMMARLIAARLAVSPREDWLIIPVPLHRWRLWRRGYNQAAVLAQELRRLGVGPVLVDGLIRHRATVSLGGLGKRGRKRELSGAIRINEARAESIRGRSVLLVDDVLTSGATSDACVSALQRGGAVKVKIACFARVLDEALPFA
ncbi:double zinc ribbon domain-containing protein [uncultured Novosphingobium sp.]|uniref:double zinc ribbon domain-containing protein n=1 Tax=uncultured Novosphingobium sp. TaxID=292277 RepID=UPI00374A12BE